MKKILALLLALSLALNAAATPVDTVLETTVDARAYTAGAAAVKTIRVLSVDYVTGLVRFQLLDAAGAPYGSGAVFGLTDPTVTPANIAGKILALIGG